MSVNLITLLAEKHETEQQPRYLSLTRQIQQAILQGVLPAGHRLPATRELAQKLGIARNTVKSAYEILLAEGYLESRVGSGSFVARLSTALLQRKNRATKPEANIRVSTYASQFMALPALNPDQRRPLQPAIPALDVFPQNQWKRCLGYAASQPALNLVNPAGNPELCREVAAYLLRERGIVADPGQILITSGSQQGSYMVAKLLTDPDDQVLLETPGFPGTAGAFRSHGCHLQMVELDPMPELLPAARLLGLTPTRNFPLGHTLSLEGRLTLINWAEKHNSWILEDDYDSEFAVGRPVSALYSISESQRVIYAGTFSRSMYPGLRLGYLVLPEALCELFLKARRFMDGGLSQVSQIAMAEFMRQGYFARHLKKMRQLYAEKRGLLEGLIQESALADLPVLDTPGGMHMVLGLPQEVDERHLIRQLSRAGLGVRGLSGYCKPGAAQSGLVIGYCADSAEELQRGVAVLEDTLSSASQRTEG